MWQLLVVLAIPLFFVGLMTVAAIFEKRLLWYFGELTGEPTGERSSYRAEHFNDAMAAGFLPLGFARDLRNRYAVDYELLVSPERDCLAIIGEGKIWNIPIAATVLFSPATDGRSFYSTDSQSCVEADLSKMWQSNLAPVPNFGELWQRHQAWVSAQSIQPLLLPPERELETYRRVREAHFRSLAAMGLVTFVDDEATRWHYTVWAGIRLSFATYFVGLYRAAFRNRGHTEGSARRRA